VRDHFDDKCAGCRPAMVDVNTGLPLADDSPEMTIVNSLWAETTLDERRAWHRVTCQNSRKRRDVRFAKAFADRVAQAFAAASQKEHS